MQEFLGSVRRSLVMSGDDLRSVRGSGLAEKIGSCLRKSRAGLLAKARPALPAPTMNAPPRVSKEEDVVREIRWRRGEMIGCGAYGRVYMGMDLDSGELLAIKQVSIAAGSKDKAQTHIRELEEEVKLLKNLSHPNIVRYLGTAREDETLNILLEFVPGGSISSLLGKFGSFTEEVIRKYTKQLLEGLEYLHSNGIIHRDIKGANILVDRNGRIKLADFGASKQVVELATVSGAKSMKGTPYWMAPEVILQTGHTFSADIWSVGCTVIEMATGKPPWSQQYQEVAALFHIGTTKSHPPIPDQLSLEAKDFLLKCLQKEPKLRPSASDLLQHPFVIRECKKTRPIYRTSTLSPTELTHGKSNSPTVGHSRRLFKQTADPQNNDSVRCSTVYPEKLCSMENMWTANTSDDMCCLDDDFDEGPLFKSDQKLDLFTESCNPVSEPMDARAFDVSPQQDFCGMSEKVEKEFTFPCGQFCEEDEEVTELKIKEFLDEKAAELKKLQSPLFEEFYRGSSSTPASERIAVDNDGIVSSSNLPPKSKSPNRTASKTSPTVVTDSSGGSPASFVGQRLFNNSVTSNSVLKELPIPQVSEQQPDQNSPSSAIFSERQRKWKEELDQELERERVMKRLAEGTGSKTSSPVDKGSNRKRERLQRAFSPGKLQEL